MALPSLWMPLRAAVLPILVAASGVGATPSDPLAAHQWKHRVVLAVADSPDDPRLAQQSSLFRTMGEDARERDLRLVVVTGASAEATMVRRRFGLGPGFHTLLIGKDGGAKLSGTAPLGSDAILPLIDSMPMRRREMQDRS